MDDTSNELDSVFVESNEDIFSIDADMIINPVNCKGVSGKGLALAFKQKFPICQSKYEEICKREIFIEDPSGRKRKVAAFRPGDLLHFIEINRDKIPKNIHEMTPDEVDEVLTHRQHVVFFPTKNHWKNPSKYEYIESGAKSLARLLEKEGLEKVSTVAIPALGAGLGGLDWSKVKEILISELIHLKGKTFILIPPK